jgi:peptidoglycan/xylan/chitin deacetylase (PgdA/CDA1 family)
MYHSIGDNGAFFTVSAGAFDRQMRHLKSGNFHPVKLSELVRALKNGADITGMVAVTFDDGYKDNAENAFPILKQYGIPATIFVATGHVGGAMTNSENISIKMLDANDLLELKKSGLVEIMPHSSSHRPLTGYAEGDDSWKVDVLSSGTFIRDLLANNAVNAANTANIANVANAVIFAYPQGKYESRHVEFLEINGYEAAVTVKEGLVKPGDNLFELKRNSIDSTTTMPIFKGKLGLANVWYEKLKKF